MYSMMAGMMTPMMAPLLRGAPVIVMMHVDFARALVCVPLMPTVAIAVRVDEAVTIIDDGPSIPTVS
jgi:hypothetical protein